MKDLFIVFDEGADYDYHEYTVLFAVSDEELAKRCVKILTEEKKKALKFKIPDYSASKEVIAKYNQTIKEIFKLYPLDWCDEYESGEYLHTLCSSYCWKTHHEFGYDHTILLDKIDT